MNNLSFFEGGIELLDDVAPLWEKLNCHHLENSQHFKCKFSTLTFDKRKKKFQENINTKVKVDLVKDEETHTFIGYCISTIAPDLVGEVDSLYVEGDYRQYGLGDLLMTRALTWLNHHNVVTKKIGVAAGNENVVDFYQRYGFQVSHVILEEVK